MLRRARQLYSDQRGASIVEYTVLIGLLLTGVVATIGLIAAWVSGQWTTLAAALTP